MSGYKGGDSDYVSGYFPVAGYKSGYFLVVTPLRG
jgi:hypothetical protein